MIARCIFERIRNFITYRIAATLQLLFFFFIAIFAFRPVDFEPDNQLFVIPVEDVVAVFRSEAPTEE